MADDRLNELYSRADWDSSNIESDFSFLKTYLTSQSNPKQAKLACQTIDKVYFAWI